MWSKAFERDSKTPGEQSPGVLLSSGPLEVKVSHSRNEERAPRPSSHPLAIPDSSLTWQLRYASSCLSRLSRQQGAQQKDVQPS